MIDVIANWMHLAVDRSLTDVAYHRCLNVNGTMVYMEHLPDNDCYQCLNCCFHVHYIFVGYHRREILLVENGSYLLHLTMPNCYCDNDSMNPIHTHK